MPGDGDGDGNIVVHPADYQGAATAPPPAPVAPGPVHSGGGSPVDGALAAFGAATNADVGTKNGTLADDDADRKARAADAAAKFPENEAQSAAQMQGVAGQGGMAQMMPMVSGLAGAVGGVLGPITQLPQQMMQAGQGAMQPLMSAMQGGGKDGGLDGGDPLAGMSDEELMSSLGGDPSLDGGGGGDLGAGGGGGGGGVGDTTPASYMGPPPTPISSPPTSPAAAPSKPLSVTPGGAAAPAGSPMGGGGMMPMMPPGGMGAGGEGGKGDKPVEKRVAAPGVPNGQPVKGRMTTPPSVPVTKSVEGKPAAVVTTQKRIVEKPAEAE